MKHFAGFAASALALAISAQAFAGTVTTDGADIMIKTKGGLEVGTTDKAFSFKLGGRIQADYSRFDGFYTKNGNTAESWAAGLRWVTAKVKTISSMDSIVIQAEIGESINVTAA